MSDPEKKICRYFNTIGGCWYGDSCKFLHIPNKKPPCKFYGSSTGCRYGDSCHFSHDRTPFKSVENYNNTPAEHMKEAFKENMDPSELSGTNNNNMTQSITGLTSSGSSQSQTIPMLPTTSQPTAHSQNLTSNGTNDLLLTDNQRFSTELVGTGHAMVGKDGQTVYEAVHALSDPNATQPGTLATASETSQPFRSDVEVLDPSVDGAAASISDTQTTSVTSHNQMLANLTPTAPSLDANQSMGMFKQNALGAESAMREVTAVSSSCATRVDDSQNYALAPVHGRPNGMSTDIEIFCGSCKRILERRGNESYCTLLKDHYLECFLDKEGDHVKYVKTKAALEPGQMYWCKSCILIFEKPWSLFQHMADKAKGNKVQRWEKKIHLDWMDSVAGLMAGYDLGLFSPAKLRIDLRNLLADHHTMEEEMEAAAVTAAAMMQWLAPLSSPWRLQQREMMRKIEQLNRQMLRKANMGLNAAAGGYPMRAALTAAPATQTGLPNTTPPLNYTQNHRNTHTNSLPTTPAPVRIAEAATNGEVPVDVLSRTSPTRSNPASHLASDASGSDTQATGDSTLTTAEDPESVGPLGDGDVPVVTSCDAVSSSIDQSNATGAAGDTLIGDTESKSSKMSVDATNNLTELTESNDTNPTVVNSNNTNSAQGASARGDDGGRRVEFKRGSSSSSTSYTYPGTKSFTNSTGGTSKGLGDSLRYQLHARGSRTPGYGHPSSGSFGPTHRGVHRPGRLSAGATSVPPSRAANSFNPPSFHASLDLNCGFTDDEVEELLSQGIKPWDSEAAAALAVLRGELDHLLD